VVALSKTYSVIIEDEEMGRQAFASIDALADFVTQKVRSGMPN